MLVLELLYKVPVTGPRGGMDSGHPPATDVGKGPYREGLYNTQVQVLVLPLVLLHVQVLPLVLLLLLVLTRVLVPVLVPVGPVTGARSDIDTD